MYICKRCGEVYDDLSVPTYKNIVSVGDYTSYVEEGIDRCDCGGELTEAQQCEECGKWFSEEEIALDDNCRYLCKKCFKEWEAESYGAG